MTLRISTRFSIQLFVIVFQVVVASAESFTGTKLYFTESSDIEGDGFYTVGREKSCCLWNGFINVTIGEALKSRYVTLFQNQTIARILAICELQVYGSECYRGTYGRDCNQACGHCYNDEPCDGVTGVCNSCAEGYEGTTCNSDCAAGTYGTNCDQTCGHCYNDTACNKVTGVCDRCVAGYMGSTCHADCEKDTFGENCSQQCHCADDKPCDPVSGECEDGFCADGFYGESCQGMLPDCAPGTYGMTCSQTCGRCYDNKPCNKYTGVCERCASGYMGSMCNAECKPGTYGQDCSSLCGFCKQYDPCDHMTGECPGGCAVGRHGNRCNQPCASGTYGENCTQNCHCVDGTCNSYTGECGNSACSEGFSGIYCQCQKLQTEYPKSNNDDICNGNNVQTVLVGALIVLACITMVLVVIGLWRQKMREQPDKQPEVTERQTEHPYEDLQRHEYENQL